MGDAKEFERRGSRGWWYLSIMVSTICINRVGQLWLTERKREKAPDKRFSVSIIIQITNIKENNDEK
jgi:hypothetical protein